MTIYVMMGWRMKKFKIHIIFRLCELFAELKRKNWIKIYSEAQKIAATQGDSMQKIQPNLTESCLNSMYMDCCTCDKYCEATQNPTRILSSLIVFGMQSWSCKNILFFEGQAFCAYHPHRIRIVIWTL